MEKLSISDFHCEGGLNVQFPKNLLLINSVLFVVFGVAFIVAPEYSSGLITNSTPDTTNGLIDIRATYGGMALGIGWFFGYCSRKIDRIHIGLVASLLVIGLTAAGRMIGFVVDGSPNLFMYLLLFAELLFVALILRAMNMIKKIKA